MSDNHANQMGNKPKRRIRVISLSKLIPNALTLMGLASGLTAVRFALDEKWEFSALAVFVAMILDTLDGRTARLLNSASKFGAELDSLSDIVCFGVVPALIIYLWAMQDAGRWGWIACILFAMCCALRLARFNVALEDPNKPSWANQFFTGVPAPAGAGLALLPMIISFIAGDTVVRNPAAVAIWTVAIGALFISAVPTFSFKTSRIPRAWMAPIMIGMAGAIAFLVSTPWWTFTVILIAYLISMPFSYRRYRKLMSHTPHAVPADGLGELEDEVDDDTHDDTAKT
jgi:CDP-diacylglycerol--serine O-phosphatidyltransferase